MSVAQAISIQEKPDAAQPLHLATVPTEPALSDRRWQAVLTKDASADGAFVYAVRSTGIYCRPSCPSRRPARNRVVFYPAPADAERAGFRACRRCAPQMFAAVLEKRRLDAELSLAAEIQARLFPASAPELRGWELKGATRPCREIGGDYFDFFMRESDGELVMALGDVSGKGIAAALLVTSLHAAVRAHSRLRKPPAETLTELNRYLCENTPAEQYATLFYAELNPRTGRLAFVNAGHVRPLLRRANGQIEKIEPAGPPVGLLADARFADETVQLEPSDVLLLASDGVTEAGNLRGESFGDACLTECLSTCGGLSAAAVQATVFEKLKNFSGRGPLSDDSSLLVLRRTAKGNDRGGNP